MNDSISLPSNATEASRIRYRLALELAQDCPAELGTEIILSGSTAYGLLRLGILPPGEQTAPAGRETQVAPRIGGSTLAGGIGATEITFDDDTTADGSVW